MSQQQNATNRVPASAMFFAVTVALLIGVVVAAIVLFANLRAQRAEAFVNAERTMDNARSAANLALAVLPSEGGYEEVSLYGDVDDHVRMGRMPYGALDLVVTYAHRHDREVRMFGYGAGTLDLNGPVLQMPDRQGALHLSGNARLQGDVVVPNGDVRRGHIEGRSFTGEQLVEGTVHRSTSGMPALAIGSAERFRALCNGSPLVQEQTMDAPSEVAADAPYHVRVMHFQGPTTLAGRTIVGPCVVRCSDTLTLAVDALLDMVLVQAPYIKVESGFTGSVQCFARLGMDIGSHCRFKYPSVLAVVRDVHDAQSPVLHVGEGTWVQGGVVFLDQQIRGRATGGVVIEREALIEGELFVAGGLQLHGEARGNVIAERLLVRTPTATYDGHLLDGVIGSYPHEEPWCIGLTSGQAPRTIVAWQKFPIEG